jgi:hypothetical protein
VEAGKASVRGLVNAVLRRSIVSRKRLLDEIPDLPPPVAHSHPDWLFKRWKAAFGKNEAIALMEWNNLPAVTYFRVNPLAPAPLELPGEPIEDAPGFYQLEGRPCRANSLPPVRFIFRIPPPGIRLTCWLPCPASAFSTPAPLPAARLS